jgi:MFS transporter, DHA1 family, inner membrane transport protein
VRFAAALPHGIDLGVAALVAAALAPPNPRARAVSYVVLGLTTAMLAGAPIATWLGQQFA